MKDCKNIRPIEILLVEDSPSDANLTIREFSKAKIEVCAEPMGEQVQISVRDFGIGIAKDQLEAIFESFYQIDSSSTRRYGGTGVGLAIVQLILDRHQSQIMVDSEVGKGSTFWFKLSAVTL